MRISEFVRLNSEDENVVFMLDSGVLSLVFRFLKIILVLLELILSDWMVDLIVLMVCNRF